MRDRIAAVLDEQQRAAHRRDGGREDHAELEKPSDRLLYRMIRNARRHEMVPVNPLYNISTAARTTATVNSGRSHRTSARVRIRAPRSAPPPAPSMTGNEIAGSILPA